MSRGAFSDSAIDGHTGKRRILLVDGSRVARTTLAKRLEDSFAVIEEDNGESAWQRLMLDNSIVVVVSSLNPPRLSAHDLLERMRASALRRLRETPMVLLVSDDNPDASADEWQRQGIAGFMSKMMSKEAMAERLENVLSIPFQASVPEPSPEPREEEERQEVLDKLSEEALEEAFKAREEKREKARESRAASTSLLATEDFVAAAAALPHEMSSDESLCVLVFGIDRLSELIDRFGADVPDLLNGRIAKLLAAKIDQRDVLGRCGENHVAIVSHGVDLRAGVHFGKRVCRSMATGQITVHGRKVRLTTSVGLAATSDDHVGSPEELLALAQERLEQAMLCGGNLVCTELRPDCSLRQRDKAFVGLFGVLGEVLEAGQKETLGKAIQPLLRKIDARLAVEARQAMGLPPATGDEDGQES
ncbi:MAG: diguanylate cyclase [Candidatus Accumulibacter sp.]|jgi:diguanylate cyclase (GGDEF)-like protein|nr:diguanylate cyclase [Accumulibacter sp.]